MRLTLLEITFLKRKREERRFVDLRIILILRCGNEFLKQFLNFRFKLDDNVPWYGSTIKSSFLGTLGITLLKCQLVNSYMFFFLSGFSFMDTDDLQDSRGRGGTIFCSIIPLPPAYKHSDTYLQLCIWNDISHMFNHNACIYQTATQWEIRWDTAFICLIAYVYTLNKNLMAIYNFAVTSLFFAVLGCLGLFLHFDVSFIYYFL